MSWGGGGVGGGVGWELWVGGGGKGGAGVGSSRPPVNLFGNPEHLCLPTPVSLLPTRKMRPGGQVCPQPPPVRLYTGQCGLEHGRLCTLLCGVAGSRRKAPPISVPIHGPSPLSRRHAQGHSRVGLLGSHSCSPGARNCEMSLNVMVMHGLSDVVTGQLTVGS